MYFSLISFHDVVELKYQAIMYWLLITELFSFKTIRQATLVIQQNLYTQLFDWLIIFLLQCLYHAILKTGNLPKKCKQE